MTEPVTLAEVKEHLNLEGVDADDSYLTGLIRPARRFVETFTGRTIVGDEPTLTGDDLSDAVHAIKLIVACWYGDREGKTELPAAVGWLLRPLRKWDDGAEPVEPTA